MQAKCQGWAKYTLYTDGSKTKDEVGAGARFITKICIHSESITLSPTTTVFQGLQYKMPKNTVELSSNFVAKKCTN